MKKTILALMLFAINAQAQSHYPCVPDSIIMGTLNARNSYGTTGSSYHLNLIHFSSKYNDKPKYSFRSSCLSPAAKAKIYSLLKGEPYDFKKELDEEQQKYYGPKSDWAESKLKWIFKGDTTRLSAKLDSLYKPMRADHLVNFQAKEYSNSIIIIIGEIYLYEAIPVLKAGLKDSLYLKKRGKEDTQLTLAKLGDKYWIDHYCNLYKIPVNEERELNKRLNDAYYINDPRVFKTLYETEFKNEALGTVNYSDGSKTMPIWHWVIDGLISRNDEIERLQKVKFGKRLYDIVFPVKGQIDFNRVYTNEIRKGLLEILMGCNYDCLVDYSQKSRK